jgi:putative ABC transport system permease protein
MTTRPGVFETLRIRMISGRGFSEAAPPGMKEAVIDRTLAEQFFAKSNPLGAKLLALGDSFTVIGVADHARMYDVHQDGRQQIYVRNDQITQATLSFALRTERDPLALAPHVRAAIRRVDPQLALADVQPMEQLVAESLRQQRVSAVLIAGFALGALLLAAMGLFGVVSGSVTRRRHELAVRLALGADHDRVVRMVLGEGASLILLGLLLGLPGIYFAGRLIQGVLVGVSPFDPLTLTAVALGLGTVALASCYLPARRVTRIEPAQSLRQE